MKTSTILWGAGGVAAVAILAAISYRRAHPIVDPLLSDGAATDFTETLDAVGVRAPTKTAVYTAPSQPLKATVFKPSGTITTTTSKVGVVSSTSTPVIKSPLNFSVGSALPTTQPVTTSLVNVSSLSQAMLDALCADPSKLNGVPADQREAWRQAMIARGCLPGTGTLTATAPTGGGLTVPSGSYSLMRGRQGLMARLGL